MNHKEGHAHGEYHGQKCQPVEKSEDEKEGTDHFGDDNQNQLPSTSYVKRVGEVVVQFAIVEPLLHTVIQEQEAQADAHDEQQKGGKRERWLGGKKNLLEHTTTRFE